jgi:eukaryotic-like serine/threonine-protein kinase
VQSIGRDTVVDGRYRVVRRLGSGGMADVWCAEDAQLGRRIALKVLHTRFATDPGFVERFRREASSAAGLQHPNIVGVFDRGEWDGMPYIAMEHVDGRTLKAIVAEEGPLGPDRAIELTEQVLRAAGFAHRRGIVHRDLKPHNVLVDAEGRVRVADFGIARAGASDMTETGSIVGTAQYLSPEQAQGLPVSPRSDLYSVGVLLYELLTGRVPFDAESPVTVALKQVSEAPVPPSQRNPAVPPALEAVVLRALEKDPARRFQDADAFIAALEAARTPARPAREVRLERTPGEPWEPVAPPRRQWWWLLALLAIAAAGVAAFLLTRPDRIAVPRVVGLRSAPAAQILHDRGFEVRLEQRVLDDVRRDHVAAQDPRPLVLADEGSTVTLTVSSGPGRAAVPAVRGLSRAAAARALRRAGFRPSTRRAYSGSVPEGRVIGSTPAQGDRAERRSTVVLTISRGPRPVQVPTVTGLDRAAAEAALRDRGLAASVTRRQTDAAQPGAVLAQDPAAGTSLAPGATVALVVAEAIPTVAVPDVVDATLAQARAELRQAGFAVRVRRRSVDTPDEDGIVLDQSPAGGEARTAGTTVTLVAGRFEPPPPDTTPTPTPTPTPTVTPTPTPNP